MSSTGRFVQGRPGRRLGCTRGLHASARSAWSPGALVALLRRRKPEDYCEEALSRVRIKDYLGAVDTLNRALAIAPDYAMAHHLRGLSLSELGRHRRALAEFRQAIALDPAMTYVQYQIALQLNFLGENAEALEATDLAATLVPGDTAPLILRGSILFDLQRYDEALAAFGTALERDPGSGPVHYNRAQILRRLGRYDEALVDYDESLRLAPHLPGAREQKAIALLLAGYEDDALAIFAEIAATAGTAPAGVAPAGTGPAGTAAVWAAAIYWHRQNPNRARRLFEQALGTPMGTNRWESANMKAMVSCALGRTEAAASRLCGSTDPADPAVQDILTRLYGLLGEPPMPGIDELRVIALGS